MRNQKTTTTVDTKVGVSTFEETYTYAMNKSIQIMVGYTNNRGLNPTKLTKMRDSLEDALWLWIAGRHIQRITIEVHDNDTEQLVERFDLLYEITDPKDISEKQKEDIQEKRFEDYHEEIMEKLSEYEAPPEDVSYRIIIGVGKNNAGQEPPDIDGWNDTSLKDNSHLEKKQAGDAINAGNVDTTYEFYR